MSKLRPPTSSRDHLRGDPSAKPRVLLHASLLAAAITVYGLVTLWINRLMADQSYTVGFALRVTGRALAGLSFHGAEHLSGPVSDWFPVSVFLFGAGGVAHPSFRRSWCRNGRSGISW